MKTYVTQRHIDEGIQGSASDCAIARSLKEQTGTQRVIVKDTVAFVDHQRFQQSREGFEFVHKFDKDKQSVAPTTLELSPFFPSAESVQDWKYQHYVMQKTSMMVFHDELAKEGEYTMQPAYYKVPKEMFAKPFFIAADMAA